MAIVEENYMDFFAHDCKNRAIFPRFCSQLDPIPSH